MEKLALAQRCPWIDWAKAFGITMVLLGHVPGLPEPFRRWIYSFHMPLFFFLSGCLLGEKKLSLPLRKFLAKSTKTLLLPYILFGLGLWLFWLTLAKHFGTDDKGDLATPLQALGALAYGAAKTGPLFPYRPGLLMVLWFLPGLFSAQLLLWGLHHGGKLAKLLGSLALGGLGLWWAHASRSELPLAFDAALLALPFLGIGHFYGLRNFPAKAMLLLPCLALAAIGLWISAVNGVVDLRQGEFGQPILFFLGAGATISAVVSASSLLPANRIIEAISRHTILIFPLHIVAFSLTKALWHFGFRRPVSELNGLLGAIILTASSLAILAFFLPWLWKLFRKVESA